MVNEDDLLYRLGESLSRYRLNRNQTQAELAREAGVARRTISKAENGYVIDTRSLVRILGALGLLDRLAALFPEPRVSPMALAQSHGRVRERASGYRSRNKAESAGEWIWPDEGT
jgi:transcriptional regulator with XRE-family HTH domain